MYDDVVTIREATGFFAGKPIGGSPIPPRPIGAPRATVAYPPRNDDADIKAIIAAALAGK